MLNTLYTLYTANHSHCVRVAYAGAPCLSLLFNPVVACFCVVPCPILLVSRTKVVCSFHSIAAANVYWGRGSNIGVMV